MVHVDRLGLYPLCGSGWCGSGYGRSDRGGWSRKTVESSPNEPRRDRTRTDETTGGPRVKYGEVGVYGRGRTSENIPGLRSLVSGDLDPPGLPSRTLREDRRGR